MPHSEAVHTGSQKQDMSELGKKGAAARWGKGAGGDDDDDNTLNDEGMQQGQGGHRRSTMTRSEAGRRGAAARWGKNYQRANDDDEDNPNMDTEDWGQQDGTGRMSRSEAGRRGAAARWGNRGGGGSSYGDEHGSDWDEEEYGGGGGGGRGGRMLRSEAGRRGGTASSHKQNMHELGKKGAAARWGKNYKSSSEDDENEDFQGGSYGRRSGRHGRGIRGGYDENEHESDWDEEEYGDGRGASNHKRNMHKLGKKGAAARWGKHYGGGYDEAEADEHTGRMSRSEAGRRGAAARWGNRGGGGSSYGDEHGSDWDEEEYGGGGGGGRGGRMLRSEAGRRGGTASSHKQNMHELGKKGAAARWGKNYKGSDIDEGEYEYHGRGRKRGRPSEWLPEDVHRGRVRVY